ncbi:phage tail protein [Brevundimonas sp. A19_0]|uniref:phage tail protein n=1 Tax=Brevundimonas sp. A19_0 TaxID=2821087 RepID=UPI001AD96486|nr:phage tail protein [Brevundimonas sp. A19_0]
MKKPNSLRAYLSESLDPRHGLKTDPYRLHMVATDLGIFASARPGQAFEYRYTLELALLDFAGDPAEITVPLMLWIQRWQHDLISSPEATARGINLTVEMLSPDKVDVHIDLKLTESYRIEARPGGGHDVVYLEPPAPLAFADGPPLHIVYLDGAVIARCEAHPEVS